VTGSTVFLWLAIGVLLSPGATVREFKAPKWGLYAGVAILTICAILSIANIRYVVADNYYLKGRVVDEGQARVDDIAKAIEYNPFNDMYRAELGLAWQDMFISAISQGGASTPAMREQSMTYFTNAEQSMLQTIEFVPQEYDNYVFLANLYNQAAYYFDAKYTESAIAIAKKGVEVEPFGPAIRVQLAFSYTNQGKYDEAIVEGKRAVELDPKYIEAYAALGDAYRLSGRLEDAKKTYEAALKVDSTRADLKRSLTSVEASITSAAAGGPK
jgi:tetratricopeptide (TPR) repeat protein